MSTGPTFSGYAYPPIDDNDTTKPAYLKKSDLGELSKSIVGKPIDRFHNNDKNNKSYRVGFIESAEIDNNNNGALKITGRLYNSVEAWNTYHDMESGKMNQLSADSLLKIDPATCQITENRVTGVSIVPKSDNKNVGFESDVVDWQKMGDDFYRYKQNILDFGRENTQNTSVYPADEMVTTNNMDTSTTQQTLEQQPEVTENKPVLGEEELKNLEDAIKKQYSSNPVPTKDSSELATLKKELAEKNKRLIELETNERENEAQRIKSLDESLTSVFGAMLKAAKSEAEKSKIKSIRTNMTTPDKKTGLLHPSQRQAGFIMAGAGQFIENQQSEINKLTYAMQETMKARDELAKENKSLTTRLNLDTEMNKALESGTPQTSTRNNQDSRPQKRSRVESNLSYDLVTPGWSSWGH